MENGANRSKIIHSEWQKSRKMCHILQTIYYSTINILAAHRNNYAESIPIHRIEKSCVYQHWNHWEGGVDDTTLRARFWLLLMFLFFFVQWLLFTRGCQMMSNWFWFCRTIRTGLRYLKMLSRHDRWVPFTKVMISPKCQLEKNPGYSVQSFRYDCMHEHHWKHNKQINK